MTLLRSLLLSCFLAVPLPAMAQTYLLMVEETGCMWCARWNEEIAPIYPKTTEGRAAPLRRYDLSTQAPDNVDFARPLHYTPTFVLIRDGQEVDRLEGYPGEDFFWGVLSMMLERADIVVEPAG